MKKNKDLYEINSELEKVLKSLIEKIIAKEFRDEALEILKKSDKKTVQDFLFFGLSDIPNLACTSLDFAKDKNGEKIITKNFGNIELFG